MPFFTPFTNASQLPAIGHEIERAVMDWKAPGAIASATPFHKAKDVAAFANHVGGTILIGACEGRGLLAKYEGLSPSAATAVRDSYSKAVAQRCPLPPTIDFEECDDPDDPTKRIVAINVWPSLNLIGVKIEAHKPSEGYGDVSFVYPVRSATDARYLGPTEIAMHMTPQIRRIAVLLSRIPPRTRVKLRDHNLGNTNDRVFLGIDEEKNLVNFQGENDYSLPLDQFVTAYQDGGRDWHLFLGKYR